MLTHAREIGLEYIDGEAQMTTRKSARSGRAGKPKAAQAAAPHPESRDAARTRRTPETLRLRSFSPGFTVEDLQRSLLFYTAVLGFIVGERWTDDAGRLRGAMLKAGACELGLSQDDWAKGHDRKKGEGVRIWCETQQDIDALAARIKAAGVTLSEEPSDQPWGRTLSVDDPDGYHLTLVRRT